MVRASHAFVLLAILSLAGPLACKGDAEKPTPGVTFASPADGAKVKSPVEVCFDVANLVIQPADGKVTEGKGHHHIIVDLPLPALDKPIPMDEHHIHMGDGSRCRALELKPGKHDLRALVAYGDHVPMTPAVTAKVSVEVTE